MNILITAGTVFTIIALLFVVSTINNARRRRPLRATGSLAGGAASACAGGAAIILAFSYYGYEQLIGEQVVGKIRFSETAPQQFVARLMLEDSGGRADTLYEILGDEWQIDARVITWKPPATLLGLDPIYQLDRLSGRYASIAEETSRVRSVHALSTLVPLDVWQIARRYPYLTPGIDAHYGTATYLPMAQGAIYEIKMTRSGLIARPVNDAAREAVGDWGQ